MREASEMKPDSPLTRAALLPIGAGIVGIAAVAYIGMMTLCGVGDLVRLVTSKAIGDQQ